MTLQLLISFFLAILAIVSPAFYRPDIGKFRRAIRTITHRLRWRVRLTDEWLSGTVGADEGISPPTDLDPERPVSNKAVSPSFDDASGFEEDLRQRNDYLADSKSAAEPNVDRQLRALMDEFGQRLRKLEVENEAMEFALNGAAALSPPREVLVPVWYATNRNRVDEVGIYYGSEHADVSYGSVAVSIPFNHRIGRHERPTFWQFGSESQSKHIVISSVEPVEAGVFFTSLAHAIDEGGEKPALVFIHGFNVSFADAARRTAQIAYDLFPAGYGSREGEPLAVAPVMYSWPSNGRVMLYPHDAESAVISGTLLKTFLRDVAARSGAKSIVLLAHSMGSRTLATALNEIGLAMSEGDVPIAQEVIFAAPDISTKQFEALAASVLRTAKRTTMYASQFDRALIASKKFNGFPRLGDASQGVAVIRGLDTIDASEAGDDMLSHSYYGHPIVLDDLYYLIRHGRPPNERFGMMPRGTPPDVYWFMRHRA